jgi:hypothetical protein
VSLRPELAQAQQQGMHWELGLGLGLELELEPQLALELGLELEPQLGLGLERELEREPKVSQCERAPLMPFTLSLAVISDGVAIAFGQGTLVQAVLGAATERISCADQQSLDFLVGQCRLTNAWVTITRGEEVKQHLARHSSPVHLTSLSVSILPCRIPERPPYSKWNNE